MAQLSPIPPEILQQLLEADAATSAAEVIMTHHPAWTSGPPPAEVIAALGDPAHPEETMSSLARSWDAETLVPALLQALDTNTSLDHRQRLAWIVKQNPAVSALSELLERAQRTEDDPHVRNSLMEAVNQLAFGDDIHWPDLKTVLLAQLHDDVSKIRETATDIIGHIDGIPEDEQKQLLISMLSDESPWVIMTALHSLQGIDIKTGDIPHALLTKLLTSPDKGVSISAEKLMAQIPPSY